MVNAALYTYFLFLSRIKIVTMKGEILFQQDGATSHTVLVRMNVLNDFSPNRVISRNEEIPWPPQPVNLTVCNIF